MGIVLYELAGAGDCRFSPNCWRTRLALAHKGLTHEARPTRFTEIPGICDGQQKTIPVIEDGGRVVAESWVIANYLEDTYPDRPSLFGGAEGRALALFYNHWTNMVLHPGVFPLVVADIHDRLTPEDQAYFRENRERRLGGRRLEEVQAGREERLPGFRTQLNPLRATLSAQPFLGGDSPLYPDYNVVGAFLWARAISPRQLLETGDPVGDWVERCLDLFDGLARNAPVAA